MVPVSSELVGTLEIAHLLNVSRQRADQLTKLDPMFPSPAAELAAGRVWDAESVRTWARFRERPMAEESDLLSRRVQAAVRGVMDAARDVLATPTKKGAQKALRAALDELGTTLAPEASDGEDLPARGGTS